MWFDLNGIHDPFCDSIIRYAMITIPIIMKILGIICAQIWGICAPQPKSTNISKSAIIAAAVAIRQITIVFIFFEFAISFSVFTRFAFKFDWISQGLKNYADYYLIFALNITKEKREKVRIFKNSMSGYASVDEEVQV